MAELPIHITTHHLTLSDALGRFARAKIAPVIRFANDALGAELVLRRHNGAAPRFSASARLSLPGRDIHGRAVHHDLYVAIGQLFEKLTRRCRKRKTRLRTAPARRAARTASNRTQAKASAVTREAPERMKIRAPAWSLPVRNASRRERRSDVGERLPE